MWLVKNWLLFISTPRTVTNCYKVAPSFAEVWGRGDGKGTASSGNQHDLCLVLRQVYLPTTPPRRNGLQNLVDQGYSCMVICNITRECKGTVISIGVCLSDEVIIYINIRIPQEWPKDTSMWDASFDRMFRPGVTSLHYSKESVVQVVVKEFKKPVTDTRTLEFGDESRMPHSVKRTCHVQGDDICIASSVETVLPR